MTTVAYKDGVLCSDSQCSAGDHIHSHGVQKIWVDVGPFAAVAICGDPQGAYDLIPMMSEYTKIEHLRGVDFKEMGIDTDFLVVTKEGEVWRYAGNRSQMLLSSDPIAMGSGADFALGAMAQGATAKEAVLIASKLDFYTNNVLQTCTITVDEEGVSMDVEVEDNEETE